MALNPSAAIKLRPLDPQPILQQGRAAIWLRDPLELSESKIVMPQPLAPLLALCDGTRDLNALRASLAVRYGLALPTATLVDILDKLDQACLLDNERSRAAEVAAREAFRQAELRQPALAGGSYPADPDQLSQLLDGALTGAPERDAAEPAVGRGLIGPHIDYTRGASIYAQIWREAEAAAQEADLAVILGTDHYGGLGRITLTAQSYATPYGVLPTDESLVQALTQAIGPEAALAEELHHRTEHSIELSAVWLHHMRRREPCALLPVLCGSFGYPHQGEEAERIAARVERFVGTLRAALHGHRVLVVASADLAHVGPAFGGPPQRLAEKALLKASDEAMMGTICAGRADEFMAEIVRDGNRHNICGVGPIYLALRLLAPTEGQIVAYDQCLADGQQTSWVSVCGIGLS
ncbi:MAG: AmmeMemoRadiSam system protein B [Anaerolineae bacterium]|nr:AmmeMemoRadiSam system protein B [Anaerolineae bacterium]